jgi:tRNA pseudouridine synthase 2
MVVHLSPGHTTGTLVNALLGHCGLPACDAVPCGSSGSSSSGGGGLYSAGQAGVLGGMLEEDDLDEAEEDEQTQTVAVTEFKPTPTAAVAGSAGSGPAGAGATSSISSSSSGSSSTTGGTAGKGIIRPGIVHRLDRGTSGLMVVAKTDAVHAALCQQFKERSVSRVYNSITVGVPAPQAARVTTNVVR